MPYGTLNADTITNSNGLSGNAIGPGFKNRIINGDMRIDQRNAGASVTPTAGGTYLTDRWSTSLSVASKFSAQQSSTAPTGYTNSLLITSLSAYSVSASDNFCVLQVIEGLNCSDLGWGTASAKTVTLSFQVRSSLTGTFGGAISNSANNRSYPFTYSIASANTWTSVSVTIPGDTSGTWLTTNGFGVGIYFGLGVGSTLSGTAGSWAGATYLSATGATSVVGTSGATWYITGVQLEVAPSATSFDYRPYGIELDLCYRYYEKMQSVSGSYMAPAWTPTAVSALGTMSFYQKRANPTIGVSATSDFAVTTAGGTASISAISFTAGLTFSRIDITSSGLTIGYGSMLRCANSTGYIEIASEL